ncbi:DUF3574 domain-containing protein [Pseudoalteromonas sp. SMS1]|uniref:DUF3574 domain-containing protein n=1 Tax=Pseudoalteromonas sp. SMS1 TaxID=2908894 RepID=UPI001F3BF3EC|nr:DUF3574 domain-containing protein [Pseudoalteromonas sp. SMS1]MCF2859487.1 DUF3574 domain-containing protein [Pseudoalteromonas sp. SMS1]
MRSRLFLVYLVLTFLSGCAMSPSEPSSHSAAENHNQGLQMYFGLSKPGGGVITPAQWQAFETHHLATTFTGFSLVTGAGYYKGQKEGTKIVTLYKVTAKEIASAKALASEYCRLFDQDSVLIVQLGVEKIMFVGKE